jgi:hypothetical protein
MRKMILGLMLLAAPAAAQVTAGSNIKVRQYNTAVLGYNTAIKNFNDCMNGYVANGNADMQRIKQKLDEAVAAANAR